jgi:sulfate transporter 4
LAAIVISAVITIFDWAEPIHLWKILKLDCLTWAVSFLGTIIFGVQIGLLSAVVCSLLITLYDSAYPHTAVLGRLPGSTMYRDVKQYPDAEQYPGIIICRVDAHLFFANAQYIREVSFPFPADAYYIIRFIMNHNLDENHSRLTIPIRN